MVDKKESPIGLEHSPHFSQCHEGTANAAERPCGNSGINGGVGQRNVFRARLHKFHRKRYILCALASHCCEFLRGFECNQFRNVVVERQIKPRPCPNFQDHTLRLTHNGRTELLDLLSAHRRV